MEISLSVRHGEAPEAVKEYAREEVAGLTKWFARLVGADVTLSQEGHRHIVEVRLSGAHDVHVASAEATDFRLAIDETIDRLRRQLKKRKEKFSEYLPKEERERRATLARHAGGEGDEPTMPPGDWPRITVAEATSRIEESREEVLVFVDAVDGAVKIARLDGDGVRVEEAESFGAEEA